MEIKKILWHNASNEKPKDDIEVICVNHDGNWHKSKLSQCDSDEVRIWAYENELLNANNDSYKSEYSCIETTYYVGSKPRWKVGDCLAYYEFERDCEGETILGKVNSVKFDDDCEDWFYTFENGDEYNEEFLLEQSAYIKELKK